MRKLTPVENNYQMIMFEKYPSRMDWNIDQKQAYRIGFTEGIDYLQERIKELEAQIAEIQLQYNGIIEQAKYTKNPIITTGLATAITGKSLFEVTK